MKKEDKSKKGITLMPGESTSLAFPMNPEKDNDMPKKDFAAYHSAFPPSSLINLDKANLKIRRFFSNFLWGTSSKCRRCNLHWNYVTAHITQYTSSKGCSPLCTSCWKELETPENRLPYYREMIASWNRYGWIMDKDRVEAISDAVIQGN